MVDRIFLICFGHTGYVSKLRSWQAVILSSGSSDQTCAMIIIVAAVATSTTIINIVTVFVVYPRWHDKFLLNVTGENGCGAYINWSVEQVIFRTHVQSCIWFLSEPRQRTIPILSSSESPLWPWAGYLDVYSFETPSDCFGLLVPSEDLRSVSKESCDLRCVWLFYTCLSTKQSLCTSESFSRRHYYWFL